MSQRRPPQAPRWRGESRPLRFRGLQRVLISGDSLAEPLDIELARRLASHKIVTVRAPYVGSGISKAELVDWERLSSDQVRDGRYDAVILFLGVNEGFPFTGADAREIVCCGSGWIDTYAKRARKIVANYLSKVERVYLADCACSAQSGCPQGGTRGKRRDQGGGVRQRATHASTRHVCHLHAHRRLPRVHADRWR